MASFNFSTRQMSAKIVYYGPGLCGKTTSLKYIFHHTRSDARGKMVSLATETDRTLFFDLLPLEVGRVGGFHTRIQLYTVPGQVFYNSTRRLVLKGVDGIVFVADSQPAMLPSNVESFRNMEVNLSELGIELAEMPLVLQYNKRDLPEVCSVAELHEALNTGGWPEFETSALAGDGIFEVLREISKLTLVALKKQLEDGVPETLTPPAPHPKLADVAPAGEPAAAAEPTERGGLSEDEIEDRALDRLDVSGSPALVDAVPEGGAAEVAAEPADATPAAPPVPEAAAAPEATAQEASAEETEADEAATEEVAAAPEPVAEAPAGQPEPALPPADAAEEVAALAATNGRRALENALSLALPGSDLARTRNVSLDLQLRDDRDRVIHQVRDIQWNLQDVEDLQTVYLQLRIGLEREDS